jgi:ATP-dependent phosphoenolpyruvate carboxykinase
MIYDHEAIHRAYPTNKLTVHDNRGIFSEDGSTFVVDADKVAAARAELDSLAYQDTRRRAYPPWQDQLNYIYDHGVDKWKTDIVDPVKAKYPKPE